MITPIFVGRKTGHVSVPASTIVRDLRLRIVCGEWAPGAQVPTRTSIESEFGASRVTVQRALDELRSQGWVAVHGRRGTYVSVQPPHLTRYALVFSNSDKFGSKPASSLGFWTSLNERAGLWRGPAGAAIAPYYGVNGHRDAEDFLRLEREVQTHRVAGLIFASSPHQLRATVLMTEANVPRVAIMSEGEKQPFATVGLDHASFWTKALDYLAARGCRRIAFLTPPLVPLEKHDLPRLLRERGQETHPHWHQIVGLGAPKAARNAIHLMMHPGHKVLPDALIISDDNLVEAAGQGLLDAGSGGGRHIAVIAHCNAPHLPACPIDVTWLGYDTDKVLQACLNSLEAQRSGTDFPLQQLVPATFVAAATLPGREETNTS